jgi:hypothetical protein
MRRLFVPAALAVASATLLPVDAQAFCGFFVAGSDAKLTNNASQAVLVRQGNKTTLTLSNNYKGPPENFAMVVPVPVVLQKEDVKTLDPHVFDRVDSLSAPRLVEYWEQDPCRPEPDYRRMPMAAGGARMKGAAAPRSSAELGVTVEAQFTVGEYEIVILSAKESSGLETWLRQNRYTIPAGAAGALAPYVRDQSKFFVAKVDIQKVKRDAHGLVVLSPLRFRYEANELRLPVRLGLLNAPDPCAPNDKACISDKQDLIVYVLHKDSRFEAANYRNVFIPTNLEVADQVRDHFPSFYAQLFDETLAPLKGKAVVTEYAWQTTSCDPCPTPPLTASDLYTLGVDPPGGAEPQPTPAPQPTPSPRMSRRPGPWFGGGFASWVLTRMHVRYDKTTLGEDLIFREARPVVGGRAQWNGQNDNQNDSADAQPAPVNNFQARYIIRHYWTGPVSCPNPRYGQWGGPPDGGTPPPRAAKGLALAPRGKIDLKKVVTSAVPQLGLPGRPAPARRQ